MFAALRSRARASLLPSRRLLCLASEERLTFLRPASSSSAAADGGSHSGVEKGGFLDLAEVEKVLSDVRAGDVTVIPVRDHCDWTDYMVIATGRSSWHVRNIAQALIHKVKEKQKGAERMLLPSVEGNHPPKQQSKQQDGESGVNWIVIDSGKVIIHALDEEARAYYNLESFWTKEKSHNKHHPDFEEALVKIRRRNNSKKPVKTRDCNRPCSKH